jgi:hypothetical protein
MRQVQLFSAGTKSRPSAFQTDSFQHPFYVEPLLEIGSAWDSRVESNRTLKRRNAQLFG